MENKSTGIEARMKVIELMTLFILSHAKKKYLYLTLLSVSRCTIKHFYE